jgi:tripartite-type tricarboxylate transporter receptor subunit TctC
VAIRMLKLLAAACGVMPAVAVSQSTAQSYPARALRIIVPSSTGSATDYVARLVAPPLAERIGQQVVVENRAGAGTMLGGETVARAAPDGYTLLAGLSTLAINPAMYKKMAYDAQKDFAPITQMTSIANLFVVHPSLPVKSVKDLIALAKAKPDEIPYASSGTGTNPHLTVELFLAMTGTRMLHVPYKGPGPGVIDLLGGRMWAMAPSTVAVLPHVRSGRLRALGVSTLKRASVLPDIPTIAEGGVPGYESVQWLGLLAPAGTPNEIVARLHRETVAVLQTAEFRGRVAKEGVEVVTSSPAEFAAYIRDETTKWAKVVKSAGIQPE